MSSSNDNREQNKEVELKKQACLSKLDTQRQKKPHWDKPGGTQRDQKRNQLSRIKTKQGTNRTQ